jgi:hypothetical protein
VWIASVWLAHSVNLRLIRDGLPRRHQSLLPIGAAKREAGHAFEFCDDSDSGGKLSGPRRRGVYAESTGYGYDLNAGGKPFFFSVKEPEGNYRVALQRPTSS